MYKYNSKKYYREDDFLAAYYSDVIKTNPSSPLFLPLADIYFKNSRLSLAFQTCEAGLQKKPYYHSARFLLAQIYNDMEETDKAVVELEKVVKVKPDNIGATSLLAEISMRTGDVERAKELFTRLLDLNPNDKKALAALSHLPSESSMEHHEVPSEGAEQPEASLASDITDVIATGEQVMLGKEVAPITESEEEDDEFLMPEKEGTEELEQQLEELDEQLETPSEEEEDIYENFDEEVKAEEVEETEDVAEVEAAEEIDETQEISEDEKAIDDLVEMTSPEDFLEEISEEEILEAMGSEGVEEITGPPKKEPEPERIVEIIEPKQTEELIEELDEESLPPLPQEIEENDSMDAVLEEDFSASLIDDERPLEAIGEIFEQEEQQDAAETDTDEVIQKNQKVINILEGWNKKIE